MADAIFTIRINGHDVEIQAPENASPAQLRAAAEKATPSVLAAPAPVTPPQVPIPADWARPPDISPADPWARSATAGFRAGFSASRENDPFGLNPENRSYTALDVPLDIGRRLIEGGESLYGGLKQGTGQLLYNLGVSKSSPSTIASKTFEPVELASVTAGMNPAGLAPRIASGLSAANQARTAFRFPPMPVALSAEQQAKLDLYNLAQKHGVNLLPADVGGQTLKATTAGAGQTVFGGPQIRSAATRANVQMGEAAGRTAAQQGQIVPEVEAGEALKRGAKRYVKSTSDRGGRLYDRAEASAGDIRVRPESAVNAIDEAITSLMEGGQAANSPAVNKLQEYRDRLTRFDDVGGMSFNGVRQVISDLGAEAYSPEMRTSNVSRVLNGVAARAKDDLSSAIRQTGDPKAIRHLEAANRFWEERSSTINDVLEPILGEGKSGEDVVSAVEAMSRGTRGGSRRLAGVFAAMPNTAANNARATIINRLGMATPGAQNAAGDAFSSSTFLTNWNKMTPEGKRALFGNNPTVARNLDELARLAAARRSTEALGNVSRTGGALNYTQWMGRMAEGAGLAAVGNFVGWGPALAAAALDIGGGRLLTSPEFTRILANAPKSPKAMASAAARARLTKQLATVAARQPGLQPYVNKLSEAVSNTPQPKFDYSKVGEPAPSAPDYSKLSDVEIGAQRQTIVPQEEENMPATISVSPEPTVIPGPDLR